VPDWESSSIRSKVQFGRKRKLFKEGLLEKNRFLFFLGRMGLSILIQKTPGGVKLGGTRKGGGRDAQNRRPPKKQGFFLRKNQGGTYKSARKEEEEGVP